MNRIQGKWLQIELIWFSECDNGMLGMYHEFQFLLLKLML